MKLIPQARKWYRMFSVQALGLIAAIQTMMSQFPPEWLAHPIPWFGTWHALGTLCTGVVAVAGLFGRLVDQGHSK